MLGTLQAVIDGAGLKINIMKTPREEADTIISIFYLSSKFNTYEQDRRWAASVGIKSILYFRDEFNRNNAEYWISVIRELEKIAK